MDTAWADRRRMKQRRIGDVNVSAVALGTANWSLLDVDPSQVEATFDEALAVGVTLVDTALVYTKPDVEGHSERLVASLLESRGCSDIVLVATKGGHYR